MGIQSEDSSFKEFGSVEREELEGDEIGKGFCSFLFLFP